MSNPNSSIRVMGLRKYLDNPAIVEKHGGYGYDDFVKAITKKPKSTVNAVADMFGVHRLTVSKWITLLELESRKT